MHHYYALKHWQDKKNGKKWRFSDIRLLCDLVKNKQQLLNYQAKSLN